MAMGTNMHNLNQNACTDVGPHSAFAIAWWIPWFESDAGDGAWYRMTESFIGRGGESSTAVPASKRTLVNERGSIS